MEAHEVNMEDFFSYIDQMGGAEIIQFFFHLRISRSRHHDDCRRSKCTRSASGAARPK